jgi:NAD(P)-dependent dehydrogenase (short-subunit alcohol dehydrogenase family)
MTYATAPELKGRTIVITGGARGIGAEMVRAACGAGMKVAVIDILEKELNKSVADVKASGGDVQGYLVDLTIESDVIKTFAQIEKDLGRIDVLVNNAMFHDPANLLDTSLESWNKTMAINVTAPFLCAKAVIPGMMKRKYGNIINISTVNSYAMVGSDSYSVSKGGLNVLTRTIAVRYGEHGIRCNTIAPGTVVTEPWKERIERNPDIFDDLLPWYPLNRVGKPSDIASAVLFFASDQSEWVSGTQLVVDGGLLAGYAPMYKTVEGSD